MSKLDKMIEDTLTQEDQALLSAYGEQSLLGQIGGLFGGSLGWVAILMAIAQVAMVFGCLFAGARLLAADDPTDAIRWAALAGLLFLSMSVIKLMHWSQMQANRVMREVRLAVLQATEKRAA